MNSIIVKKKFKFPTILFASFLFLHLFYDNSAGEDQKESVNYSYDNTEIKLKFEEQRSIHLELPPDEYIMMLRSKGELDIYVEPKDENTLIDNLFVRECDTAVITINTNEELMYSPICISGYIEKREIKLRQEGNLRSKDSAVKKSPISVSNTNNITSEIKNNTDNMADLDEGEKPADRPKLFSYYLDSIAERPIEIRCIEKSLLKKIKQYSEGEKRGSVTICGYYKILNDCPYLAAHWVESTKTFKEILRNKEMLKWVLRGSW